MRRRKSKKPSEAKAKSASSCDDFTSERARTIGKIVWPDDDPGCLSQFYLLCSAGTGYTFHSTYMCILRIIC